MSDKTLEAAKKVYEAILAGNFDGVRDRLHEDCVIEFYGPNTIPYAGIFRGRDKCMAFFDHVQQDITIHEFTQDEFIANDSQVAVVGHLHLETRVTKREYYTAYAHIIDIEDGLWRRFRDFADTATVAHAFLDTRTPVR
ncbi:MAG: nuclear transport factor 2 family protein [Pseudomonadota bacterium]